MRIIKLSILFFLLLPIFGIAQELSIIDSLKLELNNSKDGYKKDILNQLSSSYYQKERYSDAIQYKLQELKISQNEKNDSLISSCNERLGMMYYRIGDYDKSSVYFNQALEYFEKNNNLRMIAQTSGNLANVFTRIENHQKALQYLFISKEIFLTKELYNKKTVSGLFINIGLVYAGLGELDSAMYYYHEAETLMQEENNPLYSATIFNNIGEVDFALGNYENAIENYENALTLFSSINNVNGMGSAQSNIAKVDIKLGKYKKAIKSCNEALKNFQKINSLYFIVVTEQQLSDAYEGLKNYKEAIKHLKLYLQYNDSLKGTETMDHIANLEMQHAVFKEQQKLKVLEKNAQIVEQKNKLNQARLYMTIGGVSVLLLLAILFVFNLKGALQRNKLKQKVLGQEQEQLKNSLLFKQKEVENFATYIQEKNKLLTDLNQEIKTISKDKQYKESELSRLTSMVNQSLHVDKDRKALELKIDQTHQEFIHRLKQKFPKLTKTEIRLCSLLLLDLSSKEIATIMVIEPASVKMGRNRLRKKLSIEAQSDIAKFLRKI